MPSHTQSPSTPYSVPGHLVLVIFTVQILAQDLIAQDPTTAPQTQQYSVQVAELSAQIKQGPTVELYSARGDAHFFTANFTAAVADYDQMVELDAKLDASHWRRGIALFQAGEYEKAAAQFERYHSFDDVDRENGIWRYLCQYKAHGQQVAREGLLKYRKDDREPFPAVYQMFEGKLTGEDVLKQIETAKINEDQRMQRSFYAELYVGLNDLVEGREELALKHLEQAHKNSWAEKAGYGPNYMWHVARVQCELLEAQRGNPKTK